MWEILADFVRLPMIVIASLLMLLRAGEIQTSEAETEQPNSGLPEGAQNCGSRLPSEQVWPDSTPGDRFGRGTP